MRKLLVFSLIFIIGISLLYLAYNVITVRQGGKLVVRLSTVKWKNDEALDTLVNDFKPRYYRVLYACLKSSDARQRLLSAYILARRGKVDNVTFLEAGLKDDDPFIQSMSTDLLWSLWFSEGGLDSRNILYNCKDLMNQGKLDKAIAKLTKLTRRKPNFAEAYNQLAIAYYMKGDYERSISECKTVLELNPIHFGAKSGIGECYLKLGQYEKAKRAFEDTLKITPHAIGTKVLLEKVKGFIQKRNKQFA